MSATPGCVAFAGPEKGRSKRRIIAEVPIRFRFGFPPCLFAYLFVYFRERPPKLITSDYKSTKRVATFSPTTYVSPCGRREPDCGEIQAEL